MIKSEKEKFYLAFFVIFVLAVVLVWQGIINSRININDGVREIKEKNVIIAAYGIREKTLKKNLENYNFAKNKMEEMNKYFVDENNLPDLIKEIEYISDQTLNELKMEFSDNSVAVTNAQGGAKNSGAAKKEVLNANDSYILKLNLSGTFDNLMQFIARMESSPYYSYIDSITISAESPYGPKSLNEKKIYYSANLQTAIILKVFKKQNFNG